ncbi:INT5 protein, partial [Atlantisia rogersi]|nr:INT5 protein [Atlantisia rogersi]
LQEVFPHLAPFELRLLLLSLWEYLRENHPLPQKFTFRPERGTFCRDFGAGGAGGGGGDAAGRHLGVLHSVLHRNIHRLGCLAGRFRL